MTDRDQDPAVADRDDRLRLRLALDAAYLISFEWDIRRDEVRRMFSSEPALATTTDNTADTLESVRQRVHPADREAFTGAIEAALADPQGRYASEFRILRPDGTSVWLSESGIVQRDTQGSPLRLIGLSQDVTASKKAALQLAESVSLLRTVFDSAPVMMGLVELADDDGIIHVFDSPATATFFDEPLERISGRSPVALGIPPDAARIWIDHYRQSQRLGEPVHFEYLHPHGDDAVWLSCFAVHLGRTASGRTRFSYVATDVTERRKAEEQVTAQARLLDLSGDAILVRDRDDRVTFWSQGAERLYGYTRDEALGRAPQELLKTEYPEPLASIRRSLEQDGQWQGELLHTTKAGSRVTTLSRWVLDTSRGRGQTSVLESDTDITLRKAWEAQLLESDRRKDEHLAMLAHELRNPLAPVRTAGALVGTQAGENTVLQRCAAIIERQTRHMSRLLDDLLDVMRISHGSLSLQREQVALRDVIEAAVETVRPLIEAGGHRLELKLPAEQVVIDADPVRLAQVFGNLLSNAAKFSDSPGQIAITASVEDGAVSVRVSDQGRGIPEQMAEHIFDLFVQGEGMSGRASSGLGIGLSLARRLTEMHGGKLELMPSGSDQGSVFEVLLPRFEGHAERQEHDPGRPQAEPETHPRVLVADDNRDAADMLAMLLAQSGCEVRTAYGGVEAVAATAAFEPQLVLLDLGMPDVDGYEACRRIRRLPGITARVVALTGWGQAHDRRKSLEAGFDDHLVKPVAIETLLRAVRGGDSVAGRPGR